MVRTSLVISALTALLASVAIGASLEPARPFESLLASVAAAAPGTYVVSGTKLLAVPDDGRIGVLLQADVLRGAEGQARVGVVVGAEGPGAKEARVLVNRVVKAPEAGTRLVADAGGAGGAGPLWLVRELSLEPGEYELQAVVGDARQGTGLLAIARSTLTVPDISGGGLVVTPIVAGDAASTQRASALPCVFGKTVLTPAVSRRLPQNGSIGVAFRIYNWTATDEEKPDLTVEYLFYEQGAKGLHFFNKVKPQQLNESTLGTAFVPSAGSVAAGMRIPLAPFTFGEFQLLVRVSDNRSHR